MSNQRRSICPPAPRTNEDDTSLAVDQLLAEAEKENSTMKGKAVKGGKRVAQAVEQLLAEAEKENSPMKGKAVKGGKRVAQATVKKRKRSKTAIQKTKTKLSTATLEPTPPPSIPDMDEPLDDTNDGPVEWLMSYTSEEAQQSFEEEGVDDDDVLMDGVEETAGIELSHDEEEGSDSASTGEDDDAEPITMVILRIAITANEKKKKKKTLASIMSKTPLEGLSQYKLVKAVLKAVCDSGTAILKYDDGYTIQFTIARHFPDPSSHNALLGCL
ncbi:hypothetical protein GGX14DRAFT_576084 [Mycena pura]|uniref:Uncharacterized protein n=1 Tax=Mycena pura TaxID=153505 RepID=A0AAD6UU17_9AGAR|nr:hypothetical protein GGX14DRAFT_576084 [Mycena pura]